MPRKKVSYMELIRKNKEELMKDRNQLEKIEKRVDDRHMRRNKEARV